MTLRLFSAHRLTRLLCIAGVVLAMLAGGVDCSRKKPPKKETLTADQLFHWGEHFRTRKRVLIVFKGPDYGRAREYYEEILYRFPLSTFAPQAELAIADSYYDQGKYIEAAASYNDYKVMHRTRPEYPYVVYRLGMSHYKETRRHDRDQNDTRAAAKEFDELVRDYPDYEKTPDARKKLHICRKKLARNERYIARYYFRHDRYWSALPRFKMLALLYPEQGYSAEGAYYAALTYHKLDHPDAAARWLQYVIDRHPDSRYADKARTIERREAWGAATAAAMVAPMFDAQGDLTEPPLSTGPAPLPPGFSPAPESGQGRGGGRGGFQFK